MPGHNFLAKEQVGARHELVKTATATLTYDELDNHKFIVSNSSGSVTLTVPAASTGYAGQSRFVMNKNSGTTTVSLTASSGAGVTQTIAQDKMIEIVCDGSYWYVTEQTGASAAASTGTTSQTFEVDNDTTNTSLILSAAGSGASTYALTLIPHATMAANRTVTFADPGGAATVCYNTGTTSTTFEIDTDGTIPAVALGVGTSGDYTQTIAPAATLTTGDATIRIPDTAGSNDTFLLGTTACTAAALTLTTPTIASNGWTNANHTHASTATGGTITALAFKTISISGQDDVVADANTDTLTLSSGDSTISFTSTAASDTIDLSVIAVDGTDTTIQSTNELNIQISDVSVLAIDDAAISTNAGASATAGKPCYIETQDGGAASTVGLAGALFNLKTGDGSNAASGAYNGAAGGALAFSTGDGGDTGDTASDGAAGGAITLTSGAGGAGGSSSGTDGDGGDITIVAGDAGSGGNTAGTAGAISIGETTASSTTIGRVGANTTLTALALSLNSTSAMVFRIGAVDILEVDDSAIDMTAEAATAGQPCYIGNEGGGTHSSGVGQAGGLLSIVSGAGGDGTTSSAAGAGGALTLTSGAAGDTATGAGGVSGVVTLSSGTGGGTTGATAHASGAVTIQSGTGGAATTSGSGGAGGLVTVQGGAGGTESSGGTGGTGGGVTLAGGAGGNGTATEGTGGTISIDAGTGATNGSINIGTANSVTTTIGVADAGTVQLQSLALIMDSENPMTLQIGTVDILQLDDNAISGFAGASATAGHALYMETEDGGAASSATGPAGGAYSFKTGDGANGDTGAYDGGAGGAITWTTGDGGDTGGSANDGADAGALTIITGAGGDGGAASGTDGSGGAVSIDAGAAGSGGNTAGSAGAITIGTTSAGSTTIGRVGANTTLSALALSLDSTSAMVFRIGATDILEIDDSAIDMEAAATVAGQACYIGTEKGGTHDSNTGKAGALLSIAAGAGGDGASSGVGGAGGALTLVAGAAGDTATGGGGVGGVVTLTSGAGGAASGAAAAHASGALNIASGTGGASATSGNGGAAGTISITGGTGGADSGGTDIGGDGGAVTITAGTGGASAGTAGDGGALSLDAGSGDTNGAITIGATNAVTTTVGRTTGVVTVQSSALIVDSTAAMTFQIGAVDIFQIDDAAIAFTAAAATAGQACYVGSEGGGTHSSGTGQAGALLNIAAGAGGDGTTSSVGGAGGALQLFSGAGGDTVTGGGGIAGAISIQSGTGGGTTGATAHASGAITIASGTGGASTTSGNGGAAGLVTVQGGTGGEDTGAGNTGGAGGAVTVSGGTGGAGGTQGDGGAITIDGGAGDTNGVVNIGTTNSVLTTIGIADAGGVQIQSLDLVLDSENAMVFQIGTVDILEIDDATIDMAAASATAGQPCYIGTEAGGAATAAGPAGGLLNITTGAGIAGNAGGDAGGAGGALALATGVGGASASGTAAASGAITLTTGVGGAGTGSATGAVSGDITLTTGQGGDSATSGNAGDAGTITLQGGTGGDDSSGAVGGVGGAVAIAGGTGGTHSGGTQGDGGAITIDAGAGDTNGTVTIAGTNAASLALGRATVTTTINGNVNISAVPEAGIANGDYFLFLDGGATSALAKEAIADVATLFAGGGLTAASSVIKVTAGCKETAMYPGSFKFSLNSANTGMCLAGCVGTGDVTNTNAAATFMKVFDDGTTAYADISDGSAGVFTQWRYFPTTTDDDGDACLIGAAAPFCGIYIDTAADPTYGGDAVTWEYVDAATPTWAGLTIIYDHTDTDDQSGHRPFSQDGYIFFEPPSDWTEATIDGQAAYWIRARISAHASVGDNGAINSVEHDVTTYANAPQMQHACTIDAVRVTNTNTTTHSGSDIKFYIYNQTQNTFSSELTWAQSHHAERLTPGAAMTCAAGDAISLLISQEDSGNNDPTDMVVEFECTYA